MPTTQNSPLVSIIVPVYNAEENLARCIDSICKQTYQNLEIILLNDGSKDESLEICKQFAAQDARIVVIDKENSGVSATRNLGMQKATGKYLQFADADDSLQPRATELMVEKAEEYNTDMVIAHYNRIEPPRDMPKLHPGKWGTFVQHTLEQVIDSDPKIQTFGFLLEGYMDKKAFARGLMQEPATYYYSVMWNKLYRADIVREHAEVECNVDLNFSEDVYFNFAFIRHAERFYALATPVYNYIQNSDSLIHHLDPVKLMSTRAELMTYYTNLYKEMGMYEKNKVRMYKYLFGVAELNQL